MRMGMERAVSAHKNDGYTKLISARYNLRPNFQIQVYTFGNIFSIQMLSLTFS